MGYKDVEKQRQFQKDYFQANKSKSAGYLRKRREERTKWFWELKKTLQCERCGESHPACIEFHHRDAAEKVQCVSEMVCAALAEARILEEIKKCQVLCSNCHQKLHYEEGMEQETRRLARA